MISPPMTSQFSATFSSSSLPLPKTYLPLIFPDPEHSPATGPFICSPCSLLHNIQIVSFFTSFTPYFNHHPNKTSSKTVSPSSPLLTLTWLIFPWVLTFVHIVCLVIKCKIRSPPDFEFSLSYREVFFPTAICTS